MPTPETLREKTWTLRLYEKQVADLTAWYKAKLQLMGLPPMTRSQRSLGVDALPPPWDALNMEAFNEWMKKPYELSYRQSCLAFFDAFESLGETYDADA